MWLAWIGLSRSKFYDWKLRYGQANEHNGKVPQDFWLEPWDREAIVRFHSQHTLEGYRRLAFMMLDADVVAVSPSRVYRVLREVGVMDRWNRKTSKKGKGFAQPEAPHQPTWRLMKSWHLPAERALQLRQRKT